MSSVTFFYASDLHGAEVLWRKFVNAGKFYGVDMLVMGGDIAGKAVVPLERRNGGYVSPQVFGDRMIAEDDPGRTRNRYRPVGIHLNRPRGCGTWFAGRPLPGRRWDDNPGPPPPDRGDKCDRRRSVSPRNG